jgi:hypothetical protein
MSRHHGVTADTLERLVIDAGEVRLNYVDGTTPGTLIGATRGGSVFTIETEYKEMPFDGAKGLVKGGRRITKVNVKLACKFVEISNDLIKLMLPGSTMVDFPTGTPTHKEIKRALALALADYSTTVAIIGEVMGNAQPIVCIVKNPLVDSGFELSLADQDESVVPVTFTGHFDVSDLDTEPWIIRKPLEA